MSSKREHSPYSTGRRPQQHTSDHAAHERVSGDELFVPASHLLVIDQQVSHPAFRLWCVLHRLWFLHEPPTMELLQSLMGTAVKDKVSQQTIWQSATRRSIERWLTELERAGWLSWARREETTRRYHLRTSARSATDTAVLTRLRTMLNSGRATLADVQAVLHRAPSLPSDATSGSHDSIPGSQQDAQQVTVSAADATPVSHATDDDATLGSSLPADEFDDATAESHDATLGSPLLADGFDDATAESHDQIWASHDATVGSQDTPRGSYGATTESHDTTQLSYREPPPGVLMRQNQSPYSEILQNEIQRDPTPPPAAASTHAGGDGGGFTATERYLLREGFSTRVAREFCHLDQPVVQAELERRRSLGQGIGAIVMTWRVEPPTAPAPATSLPQAIADHAASAKQQALSIAPPDATTLDIQYLALDLEEGLTPTQALAALCERRIVREGAAR